MLLQTRKLIKENIDKLDLSDLHLVEKLIRSRRGVLRVAMMESFIDRGLAPKSVVSFVKGRGDNKTLVRGTVLRLNKAAVVVLEKDAKRKHTLDVERIRDLIVISGGQEVPTNLNADEIEDEALDDEADDAVEDETSDETDDAEVEEHAEAA